MPCRSSWPNLIRGSICSKCGAEYRECPCVKLLDEGVMRRIGPMLIMFAFWTDRPSDAVLPSSFESESNEHTDLEAARVPILMAQLEIWSFCKTRMEAFT